MDNERETVVVQRRAVRAARSIRAGESISEANLAVLRPCPEDALPPYRMGEIAGRVAARDIEQGDCVRLADVR